MSAPETLPPFGLTLQPHWAWLVFHGGKNIENRDPPVAAQIGDYRGPIVITASKGVRVGKSTVPLFGARGENSAAGDAVRLALRARISDVTENLGDFMAFFEDLRPIHELAGHVVGVVDLVEVRPPTDRLAPWHDADKYGIELANPRRVELRPASGQLGFFAVGECERCGRVLAKGARHRCKVTP